MIGSLRYSPEGWVIDNLAPHAIIRLKALFPSISKTQAPPYRFRDTMENAVDLKWFNDRYELEVSRADLLTLAFMHEAAKAKRVEMERVLIGEYETPLNPGIRPFHPETGEPQALRPLQHLPINMLATSGGLLCADAIGSGKSYEAMGACLIPGALPAVVVVQGHLQFQFLSKFESFTTLNVHRVGQQKITGGSTIPTADVHIFKYNQLPGWADHFKSMGIKTVIFDEVQELRRGEEAMKGQGAKRLISGARFTMGLSATPIFNYGVEIWEIMQYCRPGLLGPKEDFLREWAPSGHILDPDGLNSYMKSQGAYLRRTKKELGVDSPPVNTIIQEVAADAQALQDAEALAHVLALRATTGTFTERGRAALELDAKMREATGIAKAKSIADFIRICIEADTPVIVGLWHREVYRIINDRLKDLRPIMYTGSETQVQKNAAKEAFLKEPLRPFLMSIRSGAGLDGLQAVCSTAIIGELDWSPKITEQFIGRLDRDGQDEPVTAFYLTTNEGSDPIIIETCGIKNAEITAVVDAGEVIPEQHTDITNLQRLVQRYLEKPKRRVA